MRWLQDILLGVVLTLCLNSADAQSSFSFNKIPLQEKIEIHILGSDEDVLHCYNLYGYNYIAEGDTVYGEFVVPVQLDTFKNKKMVTLKFCRIKEFAIYSPSGCRMLPVDEGIQLKYPSRGETVYLNFDPGMPDPVFIPCK